MMEHELHPEQQLGLPEDLRQVRDEPWLVRVVFESLHAGGDDQSSDEVGWDDLPAGAPRLLLTLLTYCYAIGLYSSDEIERGIAEDPKLAYLAAKTSPSSDALRAFRRRHRRHVQRTLSHLLQAVWSSCTEKDGAAGLLDDVRPMIERAAQRRIDRAVLVDMMALDN